MTAMFGGIEAGGTKFVLGIGTGPQDVVARTIIPTTTPAETIGAAKAWFATQPKVKALGIASFGPVQLDASAANWGNITQTTKPGWSETDFARYMGTALGVPVGFDTDVNGAALGEARWGAAQGCSTAVYVTIGTGIGGGGIVDGKPLHGLGHPEMGHVLPQLHPADADFAGICPFHGRCFEGLASGPAIKARWGQSLSELPADHEAHAIIAWYLGQFVTTLQAILAPQRIILGGGVMNAPGLIDRVRAIAGDLGARYFSGDLREIVTLPGLGEHSGLMGAFVLADQALTTSAIASATRA